MKITSSRFRKIGAMFAVFLFVVFTVFGCRNANSHCTVDDFQVNASADKLSRLDHYIKNAMEQWDVPGLAIVVVKGDSTLFAKGYGVREVGTRDSVNTSTIFSLLSPGKTFTTTALAILVEEGKLSWDDPVIQHLPDFRLSDSFRTQQLTIRDLVTHRSGFADPVHLWHESGLSREEIVDRLATIEPVDPSRTEFNYNNVMYVVAGEVIEAVSALSWDEFIRKRILNPLDMSRSATTLSALGDPTNVASPHARRFFNMFGGVRPRENISFENIAPAGGIQTNVEDMAAWIKLHLNGGKYKGRRLLKEATIRDLRKPRIEFPDGQLGPLQRVTDGMAYGTGWFVLDYRGRKIAMHGGGAPGQRSFVGIMPSKNLGVVVLSNRGGTEICQALTYYVFDLFIKGKPLDWNEIFYEASRSWWQFW